MRRRTYILAGCVAVLLLGALPFLLEERPLDLSKDEEPFRSMVLPPREVKGGICMDGGSVGFQMIDKDGVQFEICFPFDNHGGTITRPLAYQGNIDDLNLVQLKDPERAKKIVVRLLKDQGVTNSSHHETESAIRALSEPVTAVPARMLEGAMRWFDDFVARW